MPFTSKKKTGKGATGRPKGAVGKTNVGGMDSEELRTYNRAAKRKERASSDASETSNTAHTSNVPSTPSGKKVTRSGTVYSPTTEAEQHPKSVGRPPLGSQAMTPNTLNTRKRTLYYAKEEEKKKLQKTQQVSTLRSAAADVRWKNRLLDDEDAQQSTSDEQIPADNDETSVREEEIVSAVAAATHDKSPGSNEKLPSVRTVLRAKSELLPVLPKNVFDSLKVFKSIYIRMGDDEHFKTQLRTLPALEGTMTKGQFDHRSKKIMIIFERHQSSGDALFKVWLERVTAIPTVEEFIEEHGLEIPESILPQSFLLSRITKHEVQTLLSCSSKLGATTEQRHVGTQLVVNVAKAAKLDPEHHGDITLLANTVSCGIRFARKVLKALKNGEEHTLFEKNIRCDSVLATDWPQKLEQFVLEPENSRAVPGQDTISIRYGKRAPKYLLLKSKREIARNFKTLFPDCKFSESTLIREFPAYAVQPSSRDIERNSCPIHSNARRLVKAINKELRKNKTPSLPTSCKQLSLKIMCNDGSQTVDPLTWNKQCATGECDSCPRLEINVEEEKLSAQVPFCQWESRKQNVKDRNGEMKEKYVFALYPYTMSMKDAIKMLEQNLPAVRKHVYTAHRQWHAHKVYRENLDESSMISIEDFQMNIDPELVEQPTSTAYSANKVAFALYPICVEYLDNNELKKAAIVFISSDKKHDHQQVQRFEERLFEIVRERIRPGIVNWFRLSDGCDGQFKSRFCVADLFNDIQKLQLEQAGFHFFESHEGKSASDSIGAMSKCGFRRGLLKDENIVIRTADDVVEVIRREVGEKTNKYEFVVVESFEPFERSTERDELAIDGIMQLHSFIVKDGKLYFANQSCTDCRVNKICDSCSAEPDADESYIKRVDAEEETDTQVDGFRDDEDDGKTDDDSDSDSDDEEETRDVDECTNIGDIVWAKHGRTWYPATIVGLDVVPPQVLQHLGRNLDKKQIVKWWGEENFSALDEKNIEPLARNKSDEFRANRSTYISKLYHQALAETISE